MKLITSKLYYSALLLTSLLIVENSVFAKGELLSKKYNWNYNVNEGATIRLTNYDCDVNIESSSSGKVAFELVIDAESDDQGDIDKLNDYLQNLKFQSKADLVSLETVFWDSRNYNKLRGNNDIRIKLKNGETIMLSEFKVSANLLVPKSSNLEISTKYSKIKMDDITAFKLDSHDDKIVGKSVNGKAIISAKYTDFEFDELGHCEFDLHDCNFKAAKTGDLDLTTKYSDIKIAHVGNVEVEGHDDNLTFETTGNLKIDTKYSDIRSEISGDLTLHIHDSNFYIEKIGRLDISESKYSDYKIREAGVVQIISSFDDNYYINNIVSLNVKSSKYSVFSHDIVDSHVKIVESFDDNIKVFDTSSKFKGLELNGKYTDIKLNTLAGLPLRVDWKTKYGKIDLDDADFTTRIKIKENSDYEYHGFRGKESQNMPLVKVRGHNNKMDLR